MSGEKKLFGTTKSQLCPSRVNSVRLTLAITVWASKNGALFYVSEVLDQLSDILLCLLFAEHANEEFAVFWKKNCCPNSTKVMKILVIAEGIRLGTGSKEPTQFK